MKAFDRLGRYRLLTLLGRGGMGEVWAARDRRGNVVALKSLLPELSDDGRARRLFDVEASLAKSAFHENFCRVHDVGTHQGRPFIVMDCIDGVSLEELRRLTPAARLPAGVAVRIALDAARALAALHALTDGAGGALGVVHRDVSPQNLVVDGSGQARILDLGVAKSSQEGRVVTNPGYAKGKVDYMSPEQVYCDDVDATTDVFALGVVLYESTTGRHPFSQATHVATLVRIGDPEPARPPGELDADFPEALSRVVLRALEKEPGRRFLAMQDLVEALEALAAELPRATRFDVAAFVAGAAGDTMDARRTAIRAALALHRAKRTKLRLGAAAAASVVLVALGAALSGSPSGTRAPARPPLTAAGASAGTEPRPATAIPASGAPETPKTAPPTLANPVLRPPEVAGSAAPVRSATRRPQKTAPGDDILGGRE